MRLVPEAASRRAVMLAAVAVVACNRSWGGVVTDQRIPAEARPCRPVRTATELTDAVGRAIGNNNWALGESLTPPLPAHWPPGMAGGVVFFTYKLTPLPTGRVAVRVRGPLREITFATLDAVPVVRALDADSLGVAEYSSAFDDVGPQDLSAASDALIEIVAGCRPAADAHVTLAPYRAWLRENQPIAVDLEGRVPEFIAWVQSDR